MNISPDISVIMPVYNGEEYLAEAIDSILAQTFSNFEFIIIDDASTDRTPSILRKYAEMDSRVRIITNEINKKIAASLNYGIAVARSPLVARMDADDWSHPERLEKQLTFMQANPDVGICGTWLEVYETGDVWEWPCADARIRVHMLFNSPIAHPTVMMRRNILMNAGCYALDMPPAEDYDLWEKLSQLDVTFANIPAVLLRYRWYPKKDRSAYRDAQIRRADGVRLHLIQRLGLEPDERERVVHSILSRSREPKCLDDVWSVMQWVKRLLAANAEKKVYAHPVLRENLRTLQRGLVRRLLWCRWRTYCQKYMPGWLQRSYLWAKALIRSH